MNFSRQSIKFVPLKGSPPIPIQVDCPRPTRVVWLTASYVKVPLRLTIPEIDQDWRYTLVSIQNIGGYTILLTYYSRLMDRSRHYTNLAFVRLNDSWTIRTNQSWFTLRFEDVFDSNHLVLGNSFCYTYNQRNFSFHCLQDCSCCCWRRNINNSGITLRFLNSLSQSRKIDRLENIDNSYFFYRSKNGKLIFFAGWLPIASSFFRVYTTNHLSSILHCLFGMEGPLWQWLILQGRSHNEEKQTVLVFQWDPGIWLWYFYLQIHVLWSSLSAETKRMRYWEKGKWTRKQTNLATH